MTRRLNTITRITPILLHARSPSDSLVERYYARTGAVGIGSDIPARSASRAKPGAT